MAVDDVVNTMHSLVDLVSGRGVGCVVRAHVHSLCQCEKRTLLTDFAWKGRLGQGAFGRVHLCENRYNRELRAIKMVMPKGSEDSTKFSEALSETRLHQKVANSDYVATIFSWETITNDPNSILWVMMEYCPGMTLENHIKPGVGIVAREDPQGEDGLTPIKDLPPEMLADLALDKTRRDVWVKQIALGLQHIHSMRIIHRDMKPG